MSSEGAEKSMVAGITQKTIQMRGSHEGSPRINGAIYM